MDGWRTVAALNSEWLGLVEVAGPELRRWAAAEPALADAKDLDSVLGLVRAHPDAVLAALLRLGRAGHALAHRTVLQAMLGMAVRACAGRPEALGVALSELWVAIADYPLDTRPRSIAANLAWGVRRRLRPSPAPLAPVPGPAEPGAADVLARARRLELIDELTHRTLWTVYVAGLSSHQAAAELGTTATAVRWRCSWALRRLAGQAELLSA